MRRRNLVSPLAYILAIFVSNACDSAQSPHSLPTVTVAQDKHRALKFVALDRTQLESRAGFRGSELPGRFKLARAKRDFLLAIPRRALGQRFFLSGFLDASFPTRHPVSLGTRVVRFKEQNSRLYILDADDRKQAREDFPTQQLIDAVPLVTRFRGLPLSILFPDYLIIDPDEALNDLSLVANPLAGEAGSLDLDPQPFEVDLSLSQDYQSLEDGMSFRKVISGHASQPLVPALPLEDPKRLDATITISLRAYKEGAGFVRIPQVNPPRLFTSFPHVVKDQPGRLQGYITRWNIYLGMRPIHWELSPWIKEISNQPGWEGFDPFRAVQRAVNSWNRAFGFEVLTLGWSEQEPSQFGRDDRNFIFFDRDPRSTLSYANIRSNPNTGELRGASVVITGSWQQYGASGPITGPRRPRAQPSLSWHGEHAQSICQLDLDRMMLDLETDANNGPTAPDQRAELLRRLENSITVITAHELGHALGMRHNFKGSLADFPESVMDYLSTADVQRVAHSLPLKQDVQLAQFLLDPSLPLPNGPYCTDFALWEDPNCSTFDQGTRPIEYAIEFFVNRALPVAASMRGQWTDLGYFQFHTASQGLIRYLRSDLLEPALSAYGALLSEAGVPVPPSVASDPALAWAADQIMTQLLTRVYLSEKLPAVVANIDGNFGPPALPMLNEMLTGQLQGIVENRDKIRSWPSRRRAVSILHAMQSPTGRIALTKAHEALRQSSDRDQMSLTQATQLEDLIARIESALDPYFDD